MIHSGFFRNLAPDPSKENTRKMLQYKKNVTIKNKVQEQMLQYNKTQENILQYKKNVTIQENKRKMIIQENTRKMLQYKKN